MAIDKKDFEQMMNQARFELTGASEAGLRSTLFEVIKEFMVDSQCWRECISVPVVSSPPTQTYSITPKEGIVNTLLGVWDAKFIPVAAFMQETGPNSVLFLVHPPANTVASPFVVDVAKAPSLPTDRDEIPLAPIWLLPNYSMHILDGLLGRMMDQPNKSYSNEGKAKEHLQRFRQGIAIAQVAAQRKMTGGAQAWSYPRGFRTTGQRGGVSTAFPYGWGG